MSATQRQTDSTAFRGSTLPYGAPGQVGSALPARRRKASQTQPAPQPALRPGLQTRRHLHRSVLLCSIMLTLSGTLMSFTFLLGHILVAQEGERSAAVKHRLRQAQDMAQVWKDRQARRYTPAVINQKAVDLGMVRAEEKETVTLP